MIEATLTLAALLPLACLVAWRFGYQQGANSLGFGRNRKTGRFVSRRKA